MQKAESYFLVPYLQIFTVYSRFYALAFSFLFYIYNLFPSIHYLPFHLWCNFLVGSLTCSLTYLVSLLCVLGFTGWPHVGHHFVSWPYHVGQQLPCKLLSENIVLTFPLASCVLISFPQRWEALVSKETVTQYPGSISSASGQADPGKSLTFRTFLIYYWIGIKPITLIKNQHCASKDWPRTDLLTLHTWSEINQAWRNQAFTHPRQATILYQTHNEWISQGQTTWQKQNQCKRLQLYISPHESYIKVVQW